jgi:hypothetical protein
MAMLWLTNIASETSEDEITALIRSQAPDLHCTAVQIEAGDGSRPAAFVACPGAKPEALDRACARLSGMSWKGRPLACTTTAYGMPNPVAVDER